MAYEIEFITDERFKGTKKKLKTMDKRLKKEMDKLSCVSIRDKTGIREIKWSKKGNEKAHKQWRKRYIISKKCRTQTWDDVMKKINKIQAPYYKRV